MVHQLNTNIVMENEKHKIDELKKQGYDKVIVWNEVTAAGSIDHSHSFDTYILVLDGKIEISINGQTKLLKTSDEIYIPKNTIHHSKASSEGCRYITAENINSY